MNRQLLITACGLSLLTSSARANDTALHDGRDGPAPLGDRHGPESVIRMVREHLAITFGKEETAVRATFVFRNTKTDAPARQTVGFPDHTQMFQNEMDDSSDLSGPLKALVTFVNGKKRESRPLRGWVKERDGFDTPARRGEKGAFEQIWHAIDVEFPVGREVTIERRYRAPNGGTVAEMPPVTFFEYTTATGGVWKGTIGEMVADVTLTDGLTVADLLWKSSSGSGVSPARPHWRILSATKMRLVWKDFEPRTEPAHRRFQLAWAHSAEE